MGEGDRDKMDECDRDKMIEALNESGTFLHFAALQQIEGFGWDARIEVPTSSAPFVSDPMEQPGAKRDNKVDPHKFRQAISGSQNQSLVNRRTVDILASKKINDAKFHLCVESKKLNPDYNKLVFLREQTYNGALDLVSKSTQKKMNDLMSVPITDKNNNLCVAMDQLDLGLDIDKMYNFVVSLSKGQGKEQEQGKDKNKYQFTGNHLGAAATQIIEGTYGLILDSVINQVVNDTNHVDEYFLPVIVTKAEMYVCPYSRENIELDSGTVKGVQFYRKECIAYKHPVRASTRFPNQATGIDEEQIEQSSKWTVLVVSMEGLRRLLDAIDSLQAGDMAGGGPVGISQV